jgi:HK97 family phage prohead protease
MAAVGVLNFKLTNVQSDANARTFEGYGSIFGNVDHAGDVVQAGAFKQSLAAHRAAGTWPPMFFNHNPSQVPGKWIDLREDARGLWVKGQLSNTPLGSEMRELLRDGSISGLSIGYKVTDSDYDKHNNHVLKAIDLWEISIVSLPANPVARADTSTVKQESDVIVPIRQFERFLHEHLSMSNSNARRFASAFWGQYKSLQQGEPLTTSLDTLREDLQSVRVLAVIKLAADQIRSL